MEKFCIFCGRKPNNKNNEHILPQWLIELTGIPKRIAKHGISFKAEKPSYREYPFSQFQFPSCTECNCKFAKLENKAKIVIESILSDCELNSYDFDILLDWFDKIRIGLWLAYYYLDENIVGIIPKFFIQDRLKQWDRLLFIIKTENAPIGLNYIGCDNLFFRYTPSCFTLRINNYYFINMSFEFLFSYRLGFPYSSKYLHIDKEFMSLEFEAGTERIMMPLLRTPLRLSATELYQPIYANFDFREDVKALYETDYVKDNSLDQSNGIGKIFIKSEHTLMPYCKKPSKDWIPKKNHAFDKNFIISIALMNYEMQSYIVKLQKTRYKYKSKSDEKFMKNQISMTANDLKRWQELVKKT